MFQTLIKHIIQKSLYPLFIMLNSYVQIVILFNNLTFRLNIASKSNWELSKNEFFKSMRLSS